MSISASKISMIRSAAVNASWVMASRKPRAATGQTSDSIKVMKATSEPMVSWPWPAATAPKPSTTIRVALGITSRKVQNFALSRTRSIEVSKSWRLRASKVSNMCAARPNDLMTRSPYAPSSTVEATSPTSSWILRESRVYSRSFRRHIQVMGTVEPSTTSPSGQYMLISSAVTTAICTMFITMNNRPKPRNRRTVARSFMIRLSSCPLCHREWKLVGSRCSLS